MSHIPQHNAWKTRIYVGCMGSEGMPRNRFPEFYKETHVSFIVKRTNGLLLKPTQKYCQDSSPWNVHFPLSKIFKHACCGLWKQNNIFCISLKSMPRYATHFVKCDKFCAAVPFCMSVYQNFMHFMNYRCKGFSIILILLMVKREFG